MRPVAWLSVALAALAFGASACAAPAAQRATGAVAMTVERSLASGTGSFDHSVWDGLLRDGTVDGLVDYGVMSGRRAELDAYVESLSQADLGSLERDELKALLINAYNALTVVAILDNSGVESIREIDGVWTDLRWSVGGHSLTLDNIEHNILRPFFRDPRIHFAVNCASISCAPLPTWAYTGAELESQLEERSRAFLTNPANVSLSGGRLRVSRYFDWYGEDFTEEGWSPRAESVPAFIALYGTDDVREAVARDLEIAFAFADYDWSLNGATRAASERPPAGAPELAASRATTAGLMLATTDPSTPVQAASRPAAALLLSATTDPGIPVQAGSRPTTAALIPSTTNPGAPGSAARQASDSQSTAPQPSAEEDPGFILRIVNWLRDTAAGFGWLGPLFYAAVYALCVVLFMPGSALTIGAGITFGLGTGTLAVVIAANVGATLSFLIARYVLRRRVEKIVAGRPKLKAVDRAVQTQGWRVVALTRLSPVFPFNVQNYFYGLTGVPLLHFVAASLVGMLPGTLLYVYIGAASAEVAEAAGGAAGWGRTALLVAGLAATIAVVVLVTRVARRELDKALAEEEQPA